MMSKLITRLTQMIKQAFISLPSDDSETYPTAQATYNGKATSVIRLSPYGIDSNPPTNSLALLLSSQAQESVKYAVISDVLNRKKNLVEGECVLHNTISGAYVYLSEDGLINIKNSSEDLYTLLADLVDAIKNIETFGSPTTHTVSATSQTALDDIVTRIQTLLGSS